MIHERILGLGAAAVLVAGAAAGAAFAHPHPDGEGDGKKVERIVIIRDGAEHGKPGKHEVRRFEIIGADGAHHGAPGEPGVRRFEMHGDALARCDGGEKVVDESADDGGKKTKVVICTKGQPTAATAERLEEALARINTNDELSAEQKARIAIALKSAIDRARSAR